MRRSGSATKMCLAYVSFWSICSRDRAGSTCLPSSLARQKARRARSVVQTGRRDLATLADWWAICSRDRAGSTCLPSSLARQKARRARSVVQAGRRDLATLADWWAIRYARSRWFGLSAFLPRTTKSACRARSVVEAGRRDLATLADWWAICSRDRAGSACLPSSLARQRRGRARSVVQAGRRDLATLADWWAICSRDRAGSACLPFLPRTTKARRALESSRQAGAI